MKRLLLAGAALLCMAQAPGILSLPSGQQLTAPAVNQAVNTTLTAKVDTVNGTMTNGTHSGGAFSGSFSGAPTFTGVPTFNGAALNGTYSGNPTFSGTTTLTTIGGNPTFTGTPTVANINFTNLTVSGTSQLNGTTTMGSNTASASTVLNGPAGTQRILQWNTAGSPRWRLMTNSTLESGSPVNTGSDAQLFSYSDTGVSIGSQLLITRSNGNWFWNNAGNFTSPVYTFNGSMQLTTRFGNQFNLMSGGTWTVPAGALTTLSEMPFVWNTNVASTGIVTPSTEMCFLCVSVPTDSVQMNDSAGQNNLAILWSGWNFGGPGTDPAAATTQGQRFGIDMLLNQNLPFSSGSTVGPNIQGMRLTTEVTATTAGAAPGHGTNIEGIDIVALASPAVTAGEITSLAGVEVDIQNQSTIVPLFKYGFMSHSGAGDITAASLGEAAYMVASAVGGAGNAIGWRCLFCIGKRLTPFPGYAATTIFGLAPYGGQDGLTPSASSSTTKLNSPRVTNGIELSRVLFNGSGNGTGRALAVPAFLVDDQGVASYVSGTVAGVAAGLALDTPLYRLATISSVGATTNRMFAGDYIWEETCKVRGFVQVTAVDGSNNVTAVDLPSGTPSGCATNPGTLTFKSDSGASVVLNVTWTAPASQTIALGGTAALVQMGSAMAKKSSVVASLPTCNAGAKFQEYIVSDGTSPAYGATVAGGGAVVTPVVCDGATWKAH